MLAVDDYPVVECPKCGREQTDMDGFGFVACIPGCGHCRHVAAEKKEDGWRCSICGDRLPDRVNADNKTAE